MIQQGSMNQVMMNTKIIYEHEIINLLLMNSWTVDELFKKISKISREDAMKPKTNQVSKIKFVTKYNPMLPKKNDIIKKHISILHSDDALKTCFLKFIEYYL